MKKASRPHKAPKPASSTDPSRLAARDVMRTDVLVLRASDSIRSAAEQLEDFGASGAPVVDASGQLIGVLTTRDIARGEHVDDTGVSSRIAGVGDADRTASSDADDSDEELFATAEFTDTVVGRARVGDWLTPGVTTVGPDTPIGELCRTMVDENIHRVFVVEGKQLLGVVSSKDIVRLLATPARGR